MISNLKNKYKEYTIRIIAGKNRFEIINKVLNEIKKVVESRGGFKNKLNLYTKNRKVSLNIYHE